MPENLPRTSRTWTSSLRIADGGGLQRFEAPWRVEYCLRRSKPNKGLRAGNCLIYSTLLGLLSIENTGACAQ